MFLDQIESFDLYKWKRSLITELILYSNLKGHSNLFSNVFCGFNTWAPTNVKIILIYLYWEDSLFNVWRSAVR